MITGDPVIDTLREMQADLTRQAEEQADDTGLLARGLHHIGEALVCLEAFWLADAKVFNKFEVTAVADTHVSVLRGIPEFDTAIVKPGEGVLLTAQRNPNDNGVWIVREGGWARPAQPEITGRVEVTSGLLYEDTIYVHAGSGEYAQLPHKRQPR